MLSIRTSHTDEPYFRLELPCSSVNNEEAGPEDRVEILIGLDVLNVVAGLLNKENPGLLAQKTPPEQVDMIKTRVLASLPASVDQAVNITAMAMVLVSAWEIGIFGKAGNEIGGSLTHVQSILTALAQNGPEHYKTPTNKRGSVITGIPQ